AVQRFPSRSRRLEFGGDRRARHVHRLHRTGPRGGRDALFATKHTGHRSMREILSVAVVSLALAGCSRSDPELNETGAEPDLPAINETLLPAMQIAKLIGWGDQVPTVPDGFAINAMVT